MLKNVKKVPIKYQLRVKEIQQLISKAINENIYEAVCFAYNAGFEKGIKAEKERTKVH